MKYLFIVLLLAGCNSPAEKEKIKHPTISTEYIADSTLWDLPQYFDGVPKYTAVGTYTNKHIPLAYWSNNTLYHVFTDVNADGNFYVYAAKDNNEIKKVYTIENWDDPHANAIIYVDSQGYVFVHIASRGALSMFQSGKILKSKYPHELDFDCIDGCENVNFEAYPQVWLTKWGKHIGYTHYIKDEEIHPKKASRQLWYRVGDKRTLLAKGGHYAISYYDGEWLYVAYNNLINASADNRVNLYLIKTNDGKQWYNSENKPLELPLEPHSDESLVYESEGYVYLKDITNGKVSFVESSDFDPTKGERFIKEWSLLGVKTLTKTNHNYNSSQYFGDYTINIKDGVDSYTGGDMVLYYDGGEVFRDNNCNWSYVRKAINNKKAAVVSCGFTGGYGQHYILKLGE